MMGKSWSGIKKQLEKDLFADSLKDRVSYHYTRHRKVHDQEPRIAIYVDGKLFIDGTPFKYNLSRYRKLEQEGLTQKPADYLQQDMYDAIDRLRIEEGNFDAYMFLDAVNQFLNLDIQSAIRSSHPIIRMLAILDRRLGKRTLEKIKEHLGEQPEWLKNFYKLRFEAEGV